MRDLSPVEIASLLWRRRSWVIASVLVGLALAVVAVQVIPPTYRASTQILVESPRVPSEYVRTTVTSNLRERLRTIEQQIVNRKNLERIIEDMNLHSELRAEGQIDAAVSKVRRALAVEVRGNRVFTIYFKASEARVAADTANRIAELFIEENLELRELQAKGTSTFLQEELENIRRQLEKQEARVARFTLDNAGSLPSQREANLAAIANLRTRIDINLEAIENAEIRKILLERGSTAVDTRMSPATSSASRRRELERELARLESLYTDRHPDVVRLKREIAALARTARDEAEEQASVPVEDPAVRDQLDAIGLDLQRLRSERARLLTEVDRYQRLLEGTPRVEQEMLILTRDYDNVKDAHRSLLSKRLDARLAENMERQRQGEQFILLERARPPGRQYAPNARLLLIVGAAAGLLLGFFLAYVREETDSTYHNSDVLQEAFPDVNVMASLPYVKQESGANRRRPNRVTAGGKG